MTLGGAIPVRTLAWCVALALLALPVVGVLEGWFAAGRWPIRRLTVEATFHHVTADAVRQAIAGDVRRGFFATRLAKVRADVAALPWVASVEASKRWPDTLVLRIHERRPFAHWNGDRLIGRNGHLFSVPGAAKLGGLPRLAGPRGRMAGVVDFYLAVRRDFSRVGQQVSGVTLSGRNSWRVTLGDGAQVVIGSTDPKQRLQRFLDVYPRLMAGRTQSFTYADLRYTNGFAVRWPQDAPPGPAQAEGSHHT